MTRTPIIYACSNKLPYFVKNNLILGAEEKEKWERDACRLCSHVKKLLP
jgi:hypothetical protein